MEYRLYVVLAPVAAVLSLATTFRVWTARSRPMAHAVLAYLLSAAGLLLSNTLELLSPTETLTFLFARTNYVFFFAVIMSWYSFAMVYAGKPRLASLRAELPLIVFFVAALFVIFTNGYHGWYWTDVEFAMHEGFLTVRGGFGPLFWVIGTAIYLVLGAGALAILLAVAGLPLWYRRQSLLVVAGVVAPLAFNLAYVFRIFPDFQKDYTPLAYAFSACAFSLGVRRNALFRQRPLPRRALIEDISSGVVAIDRDGIISDTNPAARQMIGAAESLIGRPAAEIPEFSFVFRRLDPARFSEFAVNHNGRSIHVTVRPVRVSRPHGAVIVTMNDTTEWERLQEERHNLQVQLLDQERFATVGHLATSVAHEVNNPLTSLQSAYRRVVQISEEHGVPVGNGEIAEMDQVFSRGMDRISSVLRTLMETARPPDAKIRERFDIHEVIESTLQLARGRYRDVARLERDFHAVPLLTGDPGAISQVILNILINASQAIRDQMDAEGTTGRRGLIRIETRSHPDAVECRILNDGPPIPEEIVDRLFEPFFTTKRRGSGTGLGLAISRDIVTVQHGGSLTLIRGPLTGFSIGLPLS